MRSDQLASMPPDWIQRSRWTVKASMAQADWLKHTTTGRGQDQRAGGDRFRGLGADRAAEQAGDDRADQGKKTMALQKT
jgi:hypothetical protein